MHMTHPQIAALPLAEKLELMESIWDSLCHDPTVEPVIPDWHQAVLADRIARLDSGEDAVSPWSEAKTRIRNEAGKQ
jgi:putative addiction module component (TIGR02574 family)